MRLFPKMTDSCGCCTLKTGSFVNAILLLVGHGVMTGFYAFLVDHMYPQHICDYQRVVYKDVPLPRVNYSEFYGGRDDSFFLNPFFPRWFYPERRRFYEDALNGTNVTDWRSPLYPTRRDSSWKRRGSNSARQDSNSTRQDSNRTRQGSNSTQRRTRSAYWPFDLYTRRAEWEPYKAPCIRERRPFEADVNYLDYDLRGPFDHSVLYFNIVIWVTMMAATPLLMLGVYKESANMVMAWLVVETLLLMVGAASTVATATLMFGVIPVSIGIITLVNLVIHLGIDIYLIMIVANYRRELTTKVEEDVGTELVTV